MLLRRLGILVLGVVVAAAAAGGMDTQHNETLVRDRA